MTNTHLLLAVWKNENPQNLGDFLLIDDKGCSIITREGLIEMFYEHPEEMLDYMYKGKIPGMLIGLN